MHKKMSWLIVLVALALLLAACGPEMTTPTPGAVPATNTSSPPTEPAVEESASPPPTSEELAVDADDWHVLGSPDALVTMVEYSDFQ